MRTTTFIGVRTRAASRSDRIDGGVNGYIFLADPLPLYRHAQSGTL